MENHPLESSCSNALDTRQPKLQGWRGNDAHKNKNTSGEAEHSMVHISRSRSLLQLCHPSNTTYREDFAIEQSLRLSSKIWENQGKSKRQMRKPGIEPGAQRWQRWILPLNHLRLRCRLCGIVTKCYDLYFGSCDHIGSGWYSKCSYDVIICGGPLGDAPSIGVLCSVYKARCCRNSGLGKK